MSQHQANFWASKAPELSAFAQSSMVNRSDRHGRYRKSGPFTASELSTEIIQQHFEGSTTIGLHSTSQDGDCKWLGVDIDNHDSDDKLGASNFESAIALINRLTELGISCILEDSNGDGGFHIWILFSEPVPAEVVHRFGQWLTQGHDFELFPKQAKLSGKRLGNWLRLPGLHHSKDHVSQLWGDREWLSPEESVEAFLGQVRNEPSVLSVVPSDFGQEPEKSPEPLSLTIDYETKAAPETIVDIAERTIEAQSWPDLLESEGWKRDGANSDGQSNWTRPGKTTGVSATLNHAGTNLFHIFTDASNLQQGTYGKFRFLMFSRGFDDSKQVEFAREALPSDVVAENDRQWQKSQTVDVDDVDVSYILGDEGELSQEESESEAWQLKSVWKSIKAPIPEGEVIIKGLVRRGEVMNLIASTKVGKSWLALLLAFCIATGRDWLGRTTKKGRVLLIDNELQDSTIQNRTSLVAEAGGFQFNGEPFDYIDLRGKSVGIKEIQAQLGKFESGEFAAIILDAKYRFFSDGMQENSNDDQTLFHNSIDCLARQLDCVIVLVHHATKGSQGEKSVTDIGAGGGSQSRAVDTHLVIRPHEQADDLAVLDAAVRTFAPVQPTTIRWSFPVWTVDEYIKPSVKMEASRGDLKQEKNDNNAISKMANVFHENRGVPISARRLRDETGFGRDRVNKILRLGQEQGLFEKAGTETARNGTVSDRYILSSDYVFHGTGQSSINGTALTV